MLFRWTRLLLVGLLALGVTSQVIAGGDKENGDGNAKDQGPVNPEMAREVATNLDELLGGVIRFSEERQDLPPDALERLARLANRARELKPMLYPLFERVSAIERRTVGPEMPNPEMREELRRIEHQMMDVENGVREMEKMKGEPTPDMRAKMEKLRGRREELKAAAERLREKMKAFAAQRPMGEPRHPPRIEGEIRFFQLEHADASDVADILMRVLPPGSTVIPDKRLGKILVITGPDAYGRAERVVGELDQPSRPRPDMERREVERRESRSESTRRFDYERREQPDRKTDQLDKPVPKSGRTVGTLVEKGEDGFAVLPSGHETPLGFQYPTLMRADQKPVPSEEFIKRLSQFEKGDPIVVEWNEIEGSRVAAGVAPARDAKPPEGKDKPSEEKEKPSDGKDKPSERPDKESTILR
jgi:hypothetical protein